MTEAPTGNLSSIRRAHTTPPLAPRHRLLSLEGQFLARHRGDVHSTGAYPSAAGGGMTLSSSPPEGLGAGCDCGLSCT